MAELNAKHAIVMAGGKCVIANEVVDPVFNRTLITYSSPTDIRTYYANRTIKVGKQATNVASYWITHPDRRQYKGIVFEPTRDVPGYLNLWRGFSLHPKEGDCSLYLQHLKDNICRGDESLYKYLVTWLADAVQHPDRRPGVSIALRGPQGTGKGVAVTQFAKLFGQHFVHVQSPRLLVGRFNAHLQDAVIVFADEAFWAGDKSAEGVLKAMVTEETLPIEPKRVDVLFIKNYVHLLIASNNEWVVPAGLEERRFAVIDVGDKHIQDHDYFEAIVNQMEHGGRAALLHHLQHWDVSQVDLRKLPQTVALEETKILSMHPVVKFWFERLSLGCIRDEDDGWVGWVTCADLHNDYISTAKQTGVSHHATETELGIWLKKLLPGIKKKKRKVYFKQERCWIFPSLDECRTAFSQFTGTAWTWAGPEDIEGGD
jgi:hypothetical protein